MDRVLRLDWRAVNAHPTGHWSHRDPFDRMIAAVALQERVAVVSADVVFEAVGVERVW